MDVRKHLATLDNQVVSSGSLSELIFQNMVHKDLRSGRPSLVKFLLKSYTLGHHAYTP